MRLCTLQLYALLVTSGCTGVAGPGGVGESNSALCTTAPKPSSPGTTLVRLTHLQYDNTVRDLLGVTPPKPPSQSFQQDSAFQGFNNSAVDMRVADRLGRDYRRSAEELAALVGAQPTVLAKLSPCVTGTDACATQFIAKFGKRAFRRPLTAAEAATYLTLFKAANTLLDGTDPFAKGAQLTIEAMLQSPNFLYRVELAEAEPKEGMVALSSYEVAARLSYLLWGSMPDDALLELADSGELLGEEQVKAQTLRMLEAPAALAVADDFHSQWLDLARDTNLVRDPVMYPSFNTAMGPMMQQETLRFLRHLIFEQREPFAAVYTAPYTFVNRDLAKLYRLEGTFSQTELTKVTLDPTQRRGLLTQTGFLASHAFARSDSPIHRGVFVIRRMLGLPQGDPPPGIDFTLPPVGTGEIKTTRQSVANKTSPAGCAGCHDRINAYGFAFNNYDAVGQYRTEENQQPIDATGSVALGESMLTFTNALDLTTQLSKSYDARVSYAANWARYAYQRAETSDDLCDINRMAVNLGTDGYPVRDMIASLTSTVTFRFRPVETP